jgi:hypothetical protein
MGGRSYFDTIVSYNFFWQEGDFKNGRILGYAVIRWSGANPTYLFICIAST